MTKSIIDNKAELWMDEDSILFFKMLPKSNIEEADAIEICKVASEISGTIVHCNLVDISEMTFMDKKARSVFGGQEKATVKAVGIVSNSKFQKALVNIYYNFSKPSIPTKFFTTQTEAKNWLITQL